MNRSLLPYESKVDLSIVISCYCEERSIEEFYSRLSRTLESLGRSYEMIFVNDGSTDGTWEQLEAIYDADPRVSAIVDLYKNSGQSNAKTPGVMMFRGNAMVLIDSDLQLDPEQLPDLVAKFDEGYDIVSGYRANRRDSWTRKAPSFIANRIMRKASGASMRDFGCTFKIYAGGLVRGFEFGPFKPWRPVPVISMAGRIAEVPINHHPRKYGRSGWTFRKLFAYNMENLVNVSERPFQYLAAISLIAAFLLFLRVLLSRFLSFSILPEVTPGLILNAIVVAGLVVLGVLAAIGEFVIRSFVALQSRPAFIVRTIRSRTTEE